MRRSLDLLLQVAVLGLLVGPSPDDLGAASSANQIAAMPSLHVGWALLVAIACVAGLRSRWRWVAVAHPVLTTSVVVVTANHHWTDGLVAAANRGRRLGRGTPARRRPHPRR